MLIKDVLNSNSLWFLSSKHYNNLFLLLIKSTNVWHVLKITLTTKISLSHITFIDDENNEDNKILLKHIPPNDWESLCAINVLRSNEAKLLLDSESYYYLGQILVKLNGLLHDSRDMSNNMLEVIDVLANYVMNLSNVFIVNDQL